MVKIKPPRHKLATNAKLGKLGSQKERHSVPERKPYRYPDGKIIVVNRVEQTVRCYENSVLFHHCECVLGRYGHETPLGCYKVTDKIPDHESREFPGSLMHWSVFFIRSAALRSINITVIRHLWGGSRCGERRPLLGRPGVFV